MATPEGDVTARADATVLALGGASWPSLGSDGTWVGILEPAGVQIAPLRPANCGFRVAWSPLFRDRFEGMPIKAVELRFGAARVRGEFVVTRAGLEGGAVYALSGALRDAIAVAGSAILEVGLRPDMPVEAVACKLAAAPPRASLATILRKALHLSPAEVALMHEGAIGAGVAPARLGAAGLAGFLKAIPIRLDAPMPIARAISSAGGISWGEIDDHLMLRARPGVFVAGEMLDWEAPTGGYLLQGCFATGMAAAEGALAWLGQNGL